MVSEAPTLFPEVHEVQAPAGKGLHGYYRKTNGWIITGSTSPTNMQDFREKAYDFLAGYGQFQNVDDAQKERDARGVPWNPFREPWRRIFQLGGAKEFPVSQIIAHRWHIIPPYREVVFPQLEGLEITNYFCPECEKDVVFSSTNELEAAEYLRIHLTSGINKQHDYRPEDLRSLGEQYGIDFFSRRLGQKAVRDRKVAPDLPSVMPEPQVPDLTVNEEVLGAPRRRR